jgi:tRNA-specific 2-thiouridylase
MHWISGSAPVADTLNKLSAKTRYRQTDNKCEIITIDSVTGICLFNFKQAQWAATPGQSLVLYCDDVCLGGGIITNTQ